MKGLIMLTKKEERWAGVLEELKRKELTQKMAAKILGVTTRQVRRVLKKYKDGGTGSLMHGNRGKESHNKISDEQIKKVMKIVRDEYPDFGPTLASEKVFEFHHIKWSDEKMRTEMIKAGMRQVKSRKKAQVHQLRERRGSLGELVQIDGSPHDWFEGRSPICCLLVFIDDATGKLMWLEFCEHESTLSYFNGVYGYIASHGRPLAFYSDKHSVFRVNKAKEGMESEHLGLTQFGRAMEQLEIESIFANSPQAKGRVERMNETLQDRLPKELRLRHISTIEEANKYLSKFRKKFNAQFAVVPSSAQNLHRPLLKTQDLSLILSIQEKRVLSKNLNFQYNNIVYQIQTKRSAYSLRGKWVTIRQDRCGVITISDANQQLDYTIIKQQPKHEIADSKRVNEIMNILTSPNRQPKTVWETPLSEMTETIYI